MGEFVIVFGNGGADKFKAFEMGGGVSLYARSNSLDAFGG